MKFCSFDIEIAQETPEGERDWKQYRPLGISCAATIRTGDARPKLWSNRVDMEFGPRMTREQCQDLVEYLVWADSTGYILLTWNGLGFDFDILAEESGMVEECKELALNHVDMMFHFFCLKGFAVGLDAACKGMGLEGKPEGMMGALAPKMWAEGKYQEVLDYVAGDVTQPLTLAELCERRRGLTWITKSGNFGNVAFDHWLTVKEALELPEPDTSWMDDPWPRSKFYGWTGLAVEQEAAPPLQEVKRTLDIAAEAIKILPMEKWPQWVVYLFEALDIGDEQFEAVLIQVQGALFDRVREGRW
jgi:hypothetical protein